MKSCGHNCDGIRGEQHCLPCMSTECQADSIIEQLQRDFKACETDLCGICIEELGAEPCVRVCETHVFHGQCIYDYVEKGCTSLNITFNFLNCPTCKKMMTIPASLPVIGPVFAHHLDKRQQILSMAMIEAKAAGLDSSFKLTDPNDAFYNDWPGLALASCTFYECYVCKKPYFGGMNDCRQQMQEERTTLNQHLRCQECLSKELGFGQQSCERHGKTFIDYKCRFCCNIALYVCFNGTHFC